MAHIALIGAGNMGFALLRGWKTLDTHSFSVAEPDTALSQRAQEVGATVLDANSPAVDVLVIATKPPLVTQMLDQYRTQLAPGALVISVAAGVGITAMTQHLPPASAIIRAMPNTPAAIGHGMIVCCPNHAAQAAHYQTLAHNLLAAAGEVAFVHDETLMDAVTAVSGSGPAYVFHFIEALHAAAVAAGLDNDLALLLAKQTVFGAATLARQDPTPPATLRAQVTSPNGTTAAALEVLMTQSGGLQNLLTQAVTAAKARSIALGK